MALTFPSCPVPVRSSLEAATTSRIGALASVVAAGMTAGEAHQVFYIPPQELARQKSVASAQAVAWRMNHATPTDAIAAEVDIRLNPSNTEVTSINFGPYAAAPSNQMQLLSQAPLAGQYEVRMLRVPEVYVMAIWLHAAARDVLIPLDPAPPGLVAGRQYSPADLAAALSVDIQRLSQQARDADR